MWWTLPAVTWSKPPSTHARCCSCKSEGDPTPASPPELPRRTPPGGQEGGLQESRLLPEPLKHIKGSRLDREEKQEFRTNIREFVGWLGAGLEPAASWGVGESDQGSKAQRTNDDAAASLHNTTRRNRKGRDRGGHRARLMVAITLRRRAKLQPRPPTVNQPARFDPPIGSSDIFTAGGKVEAGNKVAARPLIASRSV